MLTRKTNLGLTAGIFALGLSLSGQALAKFTAEDAAELDAEAKATLEKFVAETKGAKEVFANAKGVLVCPTIRKGGFGVGVEGGKRVLTSGAAERLY
jgi:lipid-binding SYLF domain-containing protein